MPTYTISTDAKVAPDRKMLLTCINTGTSAAPVWKPMGYHVEDSSIEYDYSTETTKDIRGNSFTTMQTPTMTQTFSGEQIVGGDAVMNHLLDIAIVQQDARKLEKQDMLIVHDYLRDTNDNAFAERYPESAVSLTSNGGAGGNPISSEIEVQFGGTRQTGTAEYDAATDTVTFT